MNFHSAEYFSKINHWANGQHSRPAISDQIGGNKKQSFVSLEQRHLGYLLKKGIMNIAEYVHGMLNKETDL